MRDPKNYEPKNQPTQQVPHPRDEALSYNQGRPYTQDLWRSIQMAANVPPGDIDGIPGPQTAERIAVWQAMGSLAVDGKAGPLTLDAMGAGPIRLISGAAAWAGPMAIDADGAPNAYNGADTGIDHLANAGPPDDPWGYAVDSRGWPFIQGPSDACPNHYVSTTALIDGGYPESDPRRYVDSRSIPYIALPRNMKDLLPSSFGLRKGDLCMCWRVEGDRAAMRPGIFADVSGAAELDSSESFGEGSIRMAEDLGHDPYAYRDGLWRSSNGIGGSVIGYMILPGTAPDRPDAHASTIASRLRDALSAWGGDPGKAFDAVRDSRGPAR